jgi:hypothetical protein
VYIADSAPRIAFVVDPVFHSCGSQDSWRVSLQDLTIDPRREPGDERIDVRDDKDANDPAEQELEKPDDDGHWIFTSSFLPLGDPLAETTDRRLRHVPTIWIRWFSVELRLRLHSDSIAGWACHYLTDGGILDL